MEAMRTIYPSGPVNITVEKLWELGQLEKD
jgi:hypothetical protein